MAVNKVLVVDDSSTQLMQLKEIVKEAGCYVNVASSGQEAIEMVEKERPDLIFMDVVMDDVDGYKACRKILRQEGNSDIPIVFVTTKGQPADRIWGEKLGARDMITKPYTKEQILEQIKRF
ncbi:MAG: response regulator [Acidiferrobacterales bacterium]|nr:response regulator [Acidiferrobacterales bacterium]